MPPRRSDLPIPPPRRSGAAAACLAALLCVGAPARAEVVTGHCRITGAGAIASGDAFAGSVADAGGTPAGSWSHTTPALDRIEVWPDFLLCSVNGSTIGNFDGPGTMNGTAVRVQVVIRDRGVPTRVLGEPEVRHVDATRRYSPTRWDDGSVAFADGAQLTLPPALPVVVGNAGNGLARLTLVPAAGGAPIDCDYRGGASTANPTRADEVAQGLQYRFVHCTQVDEAGGTRTLALAAGSVVEVTSAGLRVQHGSSLYPSPAAPQTTVGVDLGVRPYTRSVSDFYLLRVIDAAGTVVLYEAAGDLTAGDITVELL